MSSTMNEKTYYLTRTKLAFAFAQWIDEIREEHHNGIQNEHLRAGGVLVPDLLNCQKPTAMALDYADALISYLKKQVEPETEDY